MHSDKRQLYKVTAINFIFKLIYFTRIENSKFMFYNVKAEDTEAFLYTSLNRAPLLLAFLPLLLC